MSLDHLIASGLCGFAKLLTGVRAVWLGSEPDARPRVYFANHRSHGDFVLIWAALPPHLRYRTRPVAGADYWLTTGLTGHGLLGVSVTAGLVQRYYAFRCDLDARLFAHWAACWSGLWAPDPQADLVAFDHALTGVFGTSETPTPPRPLAERVRGALRLLRHQSIALAVQFSALLGAILWHLSHTGSP